MRPRLIVATRNAGKVREFEGLAQGLGLELISLSALDVVDPEETGETFAENAAIKAVAAAQASGLWALADDSGLCVDALDGAPGVRSARYAEGDDAARWQKLLRALEGVPEARRTARFACALALASPEGQVILEEGACEGRIDVAPRGAQGFGYDPVFVVGAGPRTMAQLSRDEKSALSHRGRAFDAMRPHLIRLFGQG